MKNILKGIAACILISASLAAEVQSPALAGRAGCIGSTFRQPDTPFLPPYTGRIVYGNVSTAAQPDGGIAYTITFETAEHPVQVLNWYKLAFQQYGWNFEGTGQTSYRICGQHGKNVESSISLMSPTKQGASAQVQVYYRYAGQEI